MHRRRAAACRLAAHCSSSGSLGSFATRCRFLGWSGEHSIETRTKSRRTCSENLEERDARFLSATDAIHSAGTRRCPATLKQQLPEEESSQAFEAQCRHSSRQSETLANAPLLPPPIAQSESPAPQSSIYNRRTVAHNHRHVWKCAQVAPLFS